MPKTTTTTTLNLYEPSVVAIRQLKDQLRLPSTSAVLAHLLDELADHPATSSPVSPATSQRTINQLVTISTNKRLLLLRNATRSVVVADVVAWLLHCYHARHPPQPLQKAEVNQPGEETFTAILAFLERQRKARLKARREARKAKGV